MTSTILDILKQRVSTLHNKMMRTQTKINDLNEQIAQNQARLAQAQKDGDLTVVRACLGQQQQLQEQIPRLQKSLANIQKSHRLFERQLQQNNKTVSERL